MCAGVSSRVSRAIRRAGGVWIDQLNCVIIPYIVIGPGSSVSPGATGPLDWPPRGWGWPACLSLHVLSLNMLALAWRFSGLKNEDRSALLSCFSWPSVEHVSPGPVWNMFQSEPTRYDHHNGNRMDQMFRWFLHALYLLFVP